MSLFAAIRGVYDDSKEANAKLKEIVLEEGYTSTADLPLSAYNNIMEKIQKLKAEDDGDGESDEFDEIPQPSYEEE